MFLKIHAPTMHVHVDMYVSHTFCNISYGAFYFFFLAQGSYHVLTVLKAKKNIIKVIL